MVEAFSHTVCFFSSLSRSRFLLFHQTLFCLVLHWTCILYVYLIHSCWSFLFLSIHFAVTVVAFTFFLFRIPVDNVKRTNCVRTRSPFRCLTFDYAIYMFSSFVLQSIGNGIIIPFSMALAILMCVFFSLLFYASLKRDILVLPGYSVSFDQIIYFQCKIYFIGYGGYKTLAFNWLCKGNFPETDWTKSDFTSELCFFLFCVATKLTTSSIKHAKMDAESYSVNYK